MTTGDHDTVVAAGFCNITSGPIFAVFYGTFTGYHRKTHKNN